MFPERPLLGVATAVATVIILLCVKNTAAFVPHGQLLAPRRILGAPSNNIRWRPPPTGFTLPVPATTTVDSSTTTAADAGESTAGEESVDEEGDNDDGSKKDVIMDEKPLLPEDEREFLKEALLQSVLFADLPSDSLEALMDAFERTEYEQDEVIITQGDSCENGYVYVVAKGQCSAQVDGVEVPRPYGILRPQTLFGELGIMYNQTRQATVICRTPNCSVFQIPGDDFKTILNQRSSSTAEDATGNVDENVLLQEDDDIANAIKEIEGTKSLYGGAIIRPYKPNRPWLWRRFTGTILQHVALPTLFNMLWSLAFVTFVRHKTLGVGIGKSWFSPPDIAHPIIAKLHLVHKIWGYQQGLTTFILTFFLNQAFSFWREIYDIGRRIQHRLNDFNMLLATTAARKMDGTYTEKSESLLDEVGQISRLFHSLLWAANARRFRCLATPRGLARMASRGLMTPKQLEVLQSLDLPENQLHSAVLEWMMIRTERGIEDGTLISDPAHRQMLLGVITSLRSEYASIGDKLDGRMPLAYTHFVQVLVDVFIITAPIALFSELGSWSVVCVGVLTVFYTGLMDLAKIFLDPLNNEDFCRNSVYMDIGVLIRESNAGSTRWVNGAARLPF